MAAVYQSWLGKASTMSQPTRSTQPPILSGTGNE